MSPCSAKIASASAEEGLPAVAVAVAAEAGGGGAEGTRAFAEDLHAPEVDLLELVELRREALEVEHDVVRVLGDRGWLEDDRPRPRRGPGRWRGSARPSDRPSRAACPRGARARRAIRRRSARGAGRYVSTPRDVELADEAAVDPGKQADRALLDGARASSGRSSRSPSTSTMPTISWGGSSAVRRMRRISLERRERARRAALVGDVVDRRRCRCGPGGRPAARSKVCS